MAHAHKCEIRLTKVGPKRYHARVDCCVDVLTGEPGDVLGASAQGRTPAEAIEDAAAKVSVLAAQNPELAALLMPLVGPQMSAIMVAARYLNAPEIIQDVAAEARDAVKSVARELAPAIRTAQKTGSAIAKVGKGIGRALGKLW